MTRVISQRDVCRKDNSKVLVSIVCSDWVTTNKVLWEVGNFNSKDR